jgi:hypothetical protein
LRTVFLFAALPGILSVIVLVLGVRETPQDARVTSAKKTAAPSLDAALGRPFWTFLSSVLLFTLGNSTDAFLILRANQLGVSVALIPILWAALHVVKSAASVPGGALSDRFGRKPLILAGWAVQQVYMGFGRATETWHAGPVSRGTARSSGSPRARRRRWSPTSLGETGAARRSAGTAWPSESARCRRRYCSASSGTVQPAGSVRGLALRWQAAACCRSSFVRGRSRKSRAVAATTGEQRSRVE